MSVTSGFATDRDDRYFEDYVAGQTYSFPQTLALTEADIVEFAKKYDPQQMHLDPEAARCGRFGGLIASGWHTASLAMRLYVDCYLSGVASMGSPGVDELRWPNPVRPGDSIGISVSVLETKPSRTKSDRGVVRARLEATNQNGETVLSVVVMSILRRR
jgi:acyl dehydratase